jgi:hypothetical protein
VRVLQGDIYLLKNIIHSNQNKNNTENEKGYIIRFSRSLEEAKVSKKMHQLQFDSFIFLFALEKSRLLKKQEIT